MPLATASILVRSDTVVLLFVLGGSPPGTVRAPHGAELARRSRHGERRARSEGADRPTRGALPTRRFGVAVSGIPPRVGRSPTSRLPTMTDAPAAPNTAQSTFSPRTAIVT